MPRDDVDRAGGGIAPAHSALWAERGIPCARIGHAEGLTTIDVFMDEVAAARAATEHLLEPGHSRIAFIADNDEMAFAALHIASELGLRVPAGASRCAVAQLVLNPLAVGAAATVLVVVPLVGQWSDRSGRRRAPMAAAALACALATLWPSGLDWRLSFALSAAGPPA